MKVFPTTVLVLGFALAPFVGAPIVLASGSGQLDDTDFSRIAFELPHEQTAWAFTDAARAARTPGARAWADFRTEHPSWHWLWWRTSAHAPLRATGQPLPIRGYTRISQANVEPAARAALRQLEDLVAVPAEDLVFVRGFSIGDVWMVTFEQIHQGMRVIDSQVELRLSHEGSLIAFGVETAPGLNISNPGAPRNPAALMAAAEIGLPTALSVSKATTPPTISGPFLLPMISGTGWTHRPVYRVDALGVGIPWRAWVDAETDGLLKREPMVDYQTLDGTVSGLVHPSILDPPESRGFPFQDVDITSLPSNVLATTTTDAMGEYLQVLQGGSASADVATVLSGPVIDIHNIAGPDASYFANVPGGFPKTHDIAWDDGNSTQAGRDVFYHVNLIFEHVAQLDDALLPAPLFRDEFGQLSCGVNKVGTCNASYNALSHSMLFYEANLQQVPGCFNTGEIPRVIYHEWGHARNYRQYIMAGLNIFNGGSPRPSQLKEALADITTAFFFDDSIMPKLKANGIERNADNDYVYPDDYNGLNGAHKQGQILTGALWDMRENLMATHGAVAGKQLANELFHIAQYGGARHSTSIGAWVSFALDLLIADDDDANLANGTPNFDDIADAFLAHGIWPTSLGSGNEDIDAHAQVALVIDRSLSMSLDTPSRIDQATDAAQAFVGLMGDHDRVGVSNFNDTHDPQYDHPLVELTGGNRGSVENLIDSFTVEGLTSIGTGLEHGQLILDPGMNVPGAPPRQFLLLLGDGEENTAPFALDVLPNLPEETSIYTVYLSSSNAGEALMKDLADATGGVFLNAPDAADLLRTYVDMYALIMERELILDFAELVNPKRAVPGDPVAAIATSCVDDGTRDVQFLGQWSGIAALGGSVAVTDPAGQRIDAASITRYPGASLVSLPDGENLRINSPMPGSWTMTVEALNGTIAPLTLHLFGVADSDLTMHVSSDMVTPVGGGATPVLLVDLVDVRDNVLGEPILGASVVATTGALQFTFADDGASFDGAAGDGRYGALVSLTSESTSTTFEVEAAFLEGGETCRRYRKISLLPDRTTSAVETNTRRSVSDLRTVPNPFNPMAQIRFRLTEPVNVDLIVFDTRGRRVRGLHTGTLPAGEHAIGWDGRSDAGVDVASGVYFVRIGTRSEWLTRKISLVR